MRNIKMDKHAFDWAELAFSSKKSIRNLNAIFIAAPREISIKRFTQLVKEYLPEAPIVVGIAKENYVDGFEGQVQFKTLQSRTLRSIIDKVNTADTPHAIVTLTYFQRELPFILEKLDFQQVLFINGSWKYLFHSRPEFYALVKNKVPYKLVSPFFDEEEARDYAAKTTQLSERPKEKLSESEMLELADKTARLSFDYGFQTGVTLGRKVGDTYEFLASSFNRVVPFQTYAMHHGASRETHFSPMHDLNHYDTIHAEVALIIAAQKESIKLAGTTLFINLLPCPSCARMFTETDIAEFVYREDHSDGYGVKILELAGKKVRRVV